MQCMFSICMFCGVSAWFYILMARSHTDSLYSIHYLPFLFLISLGRHMNLLRYIGHWVRKKEEKKSQKVKESTKTSTLYKWLCKKIRGSFILAYLQCLWHDFKVIYTKWEKNSKIKSVFIAKEFVAIDYMCSKYSYISTKMS